MVERIQQTPGLRDDQPLSTPVDPDIPYDRRKLSYATTFKNPTQRRTIQTIEFLTGKLRLLRQQLVGRSHQFVMISNNR